MPVMNGLEDGLLKPGGWQEAPGLSSNHASNCWRRAFHSSSETGSGGSVRSNVRNMSLCWVTTIRYSFEKTV